MGTKVSRSRHFDPPVPILTSPPAQQKSRPVARSSREHSLPRIAPGRTSESLHRRPPRIHCPVPDILAAPARDSVQETRRPMRSSAAPLDQGPSEIDAMKVGSIPLPTDRLFDQSPDLFTGHSTLRLRRSAPWNLHATSLRCRRAPSSPGVPRTPSPARSPGGP